MQESLISSPVIAALVNSLLLLGGTGLLSLLLAAGMAWLVAAHGFPGRRPLALLLLLPLATPPLLFAFSWEQVLGLLPLSPPVPALGKGILIYSLTLYPYIYLPILLTSRQQSQAIIDTVRSNGLTTRDYLRYVTLPLARFPALSGLLFLLLQVISDYPTQTLLRLDTLSTLAVSGWLESADASQLLLSMAALLALSAALVLLLLYLRGPQLPVSDYRERPIRLHAGLLTRSLAWGLGLSVVTIAFAVPLLLLLAQLPAAIWDVSGLLRSLGLALASAILLWLWLSAGLLRGYRTQGQGLGLDLLRHTPVLMPALLLALSLDLLSGLLPPSLIAICAAGFVVMLYLVVPMPLLENADRSFLQRLDIDADAVRLATGLGRFRTLLYFRPYLQRRIGLTLALVTLFGVRELPASQLLLTGSWQTLPMTFYAAVQHRQLEAVAVPGLLLLSFGTLTLPLLARHTRALFTTPYPR